jgi:hypothetical protein
LQQQSHVRGSVFQVQVCGENLHMYVLTSSTLCLSSGIYYGAKLGNHQLFYTYICTFSTFHVNVLIILVLVIGVRIHVQSRQFVVALVHSQ